MKTILSVKINPMCEMVHSILILKYIDIEGGGYSFLEDHDTIENLCTKYQIIRGDKIPFIYKHLKGRKCMVSVMNGKTTFEGYC